MALLHIGNTISGTASDKAGMTDPTANELGLLFVETDTDKVYQWDGDSWNEVTSNAANLSGTTLNSNIVGSSLTSVGALNSGSITSGFTSIDVGAGAITTTGTITAGNLSVTGTTTTVNSTNTTISDRLIELASGAGSSTADAGIIIERGSTGNNAIMAWDESADRFIFGTTTATGSSTGNLTISEGTIVANIVGDVTGTATTVTGAAQSAITSVGTLTGLAVTGATTFGVDDTGVDVTFFGATAGRDMLWDESDNRLEFKDNTYLSMGTDADMVMYHTGSSFTIDNSTGNFTMDTANNTDFVWKHNNVQVGFIDTSAATMYIGLNDANPGIFHALSGGAGNAEGGELRLGTAADYDSTYNYYFMDVYQDDLRMGAAGRVDLQIEADGDISFSGHKDFRFGASGAFNGIKYFDLYNSSTTATTDAIDIRLITRNTANNGTSAANIIKRYNGEFTINNADTHANAYMRLYVGSTSTNGLYINNSGQIGMGVTPGTTASDKLEVAGGIRIRTAGTGGYLKFTDSDVSGSTYPSGLMWTENTESTMHAYINYDYDTQTTIGLQIATGGNDPITYNSGGKHIWQMDAATRMTLDGTNLGIGESAPANLLHVKVSDTGIAPHGSAQIVLERDGTNYLQFLTGNDGTSGLLFGDEDDNDVAKIYYDHNIPAMYFMTETALAMTIAGNGNVTIHDGTLYVDSGSTDTTAKFESSDGTAYLQILDSNSTGSYPPGFKVVGDDLYLTAGGDAEGWQKGILLDNDGFIRLKGHVAMSGSPWSIFDVGHTDSQWTSAGLVVGGTNGWTIGNVTGNQRISNNSGTFSMLNSSNAWANVEMAALQVNGNISKYNNGTVAIAGAMTVTHNTNYVSIAEHASSPTLEMKIVGAADHDTALYFGDANDPVEAGIWWDTSEAELKFQGYNNSTRMVIGGSGQIGIGGANYGTDGQVLTSTGASSAPAWEDAAGGGGGSITLTVASGETITPGMAIGLNSSGQAIPFTQSGADYTGMTSYQPDADKYVTHMQIAYDPETDLHVGVYTKQTTAHVHETANIYAVAFSVGADDVITFGTERTIATNQVWYGKFKVEYCETKQQFLVAWKADGQPIEACLIKPVAGSPTTVNSSTVFEFASGSYSEGLNLADLSHSSDHRMILQYAGNGYKPKARVVTLGSWNESHGGAHDVTLGTDTQLRNTAEYYPNGICWAHQDNSGNSGTQVIAYFYSGMYGFDVGSSGGTINTIAFSSHSAISNKGPGSMIWAGTAGETHLLQDNSSSADQIIRYNINASNNVLTEGAYANGKLTVDSTSAGQHGVQLEYYGTQDKFLAVVKRNHNQFNYDYGPPGSRYFHSNWLKFYTLYMWDGGDGGNRLYGGGTTGGAPGDYDWPESNIQVNPFQGIYTHSNRNEALSTSYNPDRNRVVVATAYSAFDTDVRIPLDVPRRGQGLFMIKTNTGMDDQGTIPPFAGFSNAASNVTAGNTVEVTITGGTNTRQSGLTIGASYYLDSWGKISPFGPLPISRVNIAAGIALSATELLVDGGNSDHNTKE